MVCDKCQHPDLCPDCYARVPQHMIRKFAKLLKLSRGQKSLRMALVLGGGASTKKLKIFENAFCEL